MLRQGDNAAGDRVIVQVCQLLKHHFIAHNRLRMRALLPELMLTLQFVRRATIFELMKQPIASLGFELCDQGARGMAFEVREDTRQIRCGENCMEMVIENDPSVDLERFVSTAVFQ